MTCPKCDKPVEECRERGACDVPTVYLINEPLKRTIDGDLERWLPLGSLINFGEVVRVLPDGSPPASLDSHLEILRAKLAGYRDGDFIALVGDLTLLAAAAVVVGGITGGKGKIKVLKWERRLESYAPVVLNFGGEACAPSKTARPSSRSSAIQSNGPQPSNGITARVLRAR